MTAVSNGIGLGTGRNGDVGTGEVGSYTGLPVSGNRSRVRCKQVLALRRVYASAPSTRIWTACAVPVHHALLRQGNVITLRAGLVRFQRGIPRSFTHSYL